MFDMTELFQRVYGTEVEYGAEELRYGSKYYQELGRLATLINYLPEGLQRIPSSGMMSNGARYYVDCSKQLEYATAEHTDIWETVAAEIAGERISSTSIEKYAAYEGNNVRKVQLFKSVYESDKVTWGYHFNIAADATKIPHPSVKSEFTDKVSLLAMHLATYNLYAGGGTIYQESYKSKFSLAQKALGLSCDFSSCTTSAKPLVNLRDEAHAPGQDILRMHMTSGDPNISPWATWMTLGTTSLVLRAIEQGRAEQDDIMHLKPGPVNHTFEPLSRLTATDLSFSKKAEFDDGKKLTPREIQEYILNIVERTDHSDQEAEVLKEWKRALEDFKEDPMLLEDRSDAFAKLAAMQGYAKKQGKEFSDEDYGEQVSQFIDHNFSTITFIDKSEGAIQRPLLSAKAREGRFKKWMPSEERIVHNIYDPPSTTRAHLRGNAIKAGNVSVASWTGYTQDGTSVKTHHPLMVREDDERFAD
jgi:hypothetical protein